MVTDVSGHIGFIFKSQMVLSDNFMLENGVDLLSRNAGNQLPTHCALHSLRTKVSTTLWRKPEISQTLPIYRIKTVRWCRLCAVLSESGNVRYSQTKEAKVLLPYVSHEIVNFQIDVVFISVGVDGCDSHELRRFLQTHEDSLIRCFVDDYLNKLGF